MVIEIWGMEFVEYARHKRMLVAGDNRELSFIDMCSLRVEACKHVIRRFALKIIRVDAIRISLLGVGSFGIDLPGMESFGLD
jgi:hypothetical protein